MSGAVVCAVPGCSAHVTPSMGPWVPLCEVHWFACAWIYRGPMFDLYRANGALRAAYEEAVSRACDALLVESSRRTAKPGDDS